MPQNIIINLIKSTSSNEQLHNKLKKIILFRLFLTAVLLGSQLFIQYQDRQLDSIYTLILYGLIIFILFFTAFSVLLLKQDRFLNLLAYFQVFCEIVALTPLVYLTGGYNSVFSFLYFLSIISSSYLLYAKGAFLSATLSGVSYSGIAVLLVKGLIPNTMEHLNSTNSGVIFYEVIIHVFAFYLMAFLSSYLAEQLKQTKEALFEEQSNLREFEVYHQKIVENINSGLMTLDKNGLVTFLNRAAENITGKSLDHILGQHVDAIFPELSLYLNDIYLEEGSVLKPTHWEKHHTGKDKKRYYLGFSSSPIRNPDGEIVGKILIFEDLTKIKSLEEKSKRDERLKTIGKLAAGMAHEIRNPLASISGSIQILKEDTDISDENKLLMDIVIRETDRLNSLLTDFLQYVKPTQITKQQINLNQIIQDIAEAFRKNPRYIDQINIKIEANHKHTLEADPDQIKQILWNLIKNSAEAVNGKGEVIIKTRDLPGHTGETAPMADLTPKIEIQVLDTGDGFEPQIIERLFDPFFSTKPGGTGLGLALVEKIVQAHDGIIRAKNRADEHGAIIELVFPAIFFPDQITRIEEF